MCTLIRARKWGGIVPFYVKTTHTLFICKFSLQFNYRIPILTVKCSCPCDFQWILSNWKVRICSVKITVIHAWRIKCRSVQTVLRDFIFVSSHIAPSGVKAYLPHFGRPRENRENTNQTPPTCVTCKQSNIAMCAGCYLLVLIYHSGQEFLQARGCSK